MLQRSVVQTDTLRSDVEPGIQAEAGGIADIVNFALAFLRRQYLVVIVMAALAMAASVVYLRITPPTYTAQVQILLAPKPQFVQQQSVLTEPPFDLTQIETQLQLVKSRGIAISVINELKLEDDPDFNGS